MKLTLSVYNQEEIDTGRGADIVSSDLKIGVIHFSIHLTDLGKNKAKTFSTLTKADQNRIVPKGLAGAIHFNIAMLTIEKVPESFLETFGMLRRTMSRDTEAGCRPLISMFLSHAVVHARKTWWGYGGNQTVVCRRFKSWAFTKCRVPEKARNGHCGVYCGGHVNR
jgi:hypothetical protein